jgi:hypothetical protein
MLALGSLTGHISFCPWESVGNLMKTRTKACVRRFVKSSASSFASIERKSGSSAVGSAQAKLLESLEPGFHVLWGELEGTFWDVTCRAAPAIAVHIREVHREESFSAMGIAPFRSSIRRSGAAALHASSHQAKYLQVRVRIHLDLD